MSGIAGLFNLDGRPGDGDLLARMSEALAHRGPDGAGAWIEGPVGLAHRMLHTTPESLQEFQPWRDESDEFCLVWDGRIDNREELRAALAAQGLRLRDATDAELVLRSYQAWGEECAARLLGEFAFALWDGRKRRFLCARDPLGVRPFYYFQDDRTFLFASEMQPLFACPEVRREPNLPLIAMYLSDRFYQHEETLYREVRRLPAAHWMTVEPGKVRTQQYWTLDSNRAFRCSSDAEYAEAFHSTFGEAVRCRMRAHGPVGATLSGGLDSGTIVSTAARLQQEKLLPGSELETFSCVFRSFACDEGPLIAEVVRKWNLRSHLFDFDDAGDWMNMSRATAEFPDVFYDPTRLMFAPLLDAMRKRGIRICLMGYGGDELLAPDFSHLTDLMRAGKLASLRRQLLSHAAVYDLSPSSLLLDYCIRPLLPQPVKNLLRPILLPLLRPLLGYRTPPLLNPDFLKPRGLEPSAAPSITQFPTRAQQTTYRALFFGWNALIAREMHELFAARFGVECRYPFLDRRVVELLIALPEEQRWREGEWRFILRQAMKNQLPESMRQRLVKAEFSPPIDRELRDRQGPAVEQLLRESSLASMGMVDPRRLLNCLERYRKGQEKFLTGTIMLLVGLELWYRSALLTTSKETVCQ